MEIEQSIRTTSPRRRRRAPWPRHQGCHARESAFKRSIPEVSLEGAAWKPREYPQRLATRRVV